MAVSKIEFLLTGSLSFLTYYLPLNVSNHTIRWLTSKIQNFEDFVHFSKLWKYLSWKLQDCIILMLITCLSLKIIHEIGILFKVKFWQYSKFYILKNKSPYGTLCMYTSKHKHYYNVNTKHTWTLHHYYYQYLND